MAMISRKMTMAINLFLVLSLFFSVSTAERKLLTSGALPTQATLSAPSLIYCASVYGVKSGDTCFAVAQTFNLTALSFDKINPNLNCNALFVGQWLCVKAVIF
ncbi:hypothetical protein BT93_D0563 [Corymbia citriodora subsp. variegata]|uniref:LysM domain-containing protein n=1 Tax=Corymbia citriodora subsp. variegata TaxID=360336 RepID=A0A8T0CJH5_CORYI|nr:hypothetical protein BT93_L2446 [Corymbia citriodora subsp. variegata]KAF8031399.1 hypothetical protein BT93_D0563 [Corymbia citriodora subsp. variegata]